MTRLAGSSSTPVMSSGTLAVRLLAECAVLTRAICGELRDVSGALAERRPCIAMSYLLGWDPGESAGQSFSSETLPGGSASESLALRTASDELVVPDGCEDLLQEIRHGALCR